MGDLFHPTRDELDLTREAPQDRVVTEEMGQDVVGGEVVDAHDLHVGSGLVDGTEEVPADPAKAVDAYTDRH